MTQYVRHTAHQSMCFGPRSFHNPANPMNPASFDTDFNLQVSKLIRWIFEHFALRHLCVCIAKVEDLRSGTVTHKDTYVFGHPLTDTNATESHCLSCAKKHTASGNKEQHTVCVIYGNYAIAVTTTDLDYNILYGPAGMIGMFLITSKCT